ncbi:NADH-quinone oxidoreductase subunit NuoN [Solimonas sp. K1W22B-7]|uniref:NADH-quinone oxidoreductase subunit NuoN n=1 Tax=Solimonas sp. K1W22B-7 TaxID=2303331 RepID=UPI000E334147|nr:NADH-quinone oxidoreductase subunit NuoN [Solimonas sp. K1W22B-7]AXQ28830.1 NADH-quinone oxidoreductase subunit NuoN [Solimonas sp. K1W22B-7]
MTALQLTALLPFFVISATIVVVMLAIAVRRHHRLTAALSVIGLNLTLLSLLPTWTAGAGAVNVTPLMVVDGMASFYMAMVLVATLGVMTLCHAYFEGYKRDREEIYLLILLGALGGMTLASANHAATLLIGLELLSLPMVAGVAYAVSDRRAVEGGAKYLVLSAGASATLLFGIALIYAATGALDLPSLAQVLVRADVGQPLVLAGAAMVLAGLSFKLSIVPFHQWTPDVYEAAPAPVTAYLATVVKAGVLAAALRLFHSGGGSASPLVVKALVILALASMIVGSLLALRQDNLKRLLAYSSIAHFGFLLIVLVAPGNRSLEAAGVYMATYLITSLGVFGVIALVSSPAGDRDRETLSEYRGMFWQRPYVVSIFTAMMLSLAGIPLTAGFIGKFAAIAVGVESQLWLMVSGIVLGSAIGIYYYLRVISALFEPMAGYERVSESMGWAQSAGGVMLLLAMLAMLAMGVYPEPLFLLARP